MACTLRAALLAATAAYVHGAKLYKGIAKISQTAAFSGQISGTLVFTAANGVMQVSGTVTGLPDGVHGFHIHQYGDESLSTNSVTGKISSRYGSHFVPTCKEDPIVCNPLTGVCDTTQTSECKKFGTHGLPPDSMRQAGDMGNIIVKNGKVSLPGDGLEIPNAAFGQNKMSLDDSLSSILGRAVAIHKFQDIGRDIPLYDGFCAQTCKISAATDDKAPPGRTCGNVAGSAKLADIYVNGQAATFNGLQVGAKVQTRYPDINKDVWYSAKIVNKPAASTGSFGLEFDDPNACARRISAAYLKALGALDSQKPDPTGAAGPAIAGGVVGRMNPNDPKDGKATTGDEDATIPATGITQISCYLRASGNSKIGGEALIVQQFGTKQVTLQTKLSHAKSTTEKKHSFHFHTYGDLRQLNPPSGDNRLVGEIYKDNQPDAVVKIEELTIAPNVDKTASVITFDLPTNVAGIDEYVGRSLTIHEGPTTASPTISYGVCGIANPMSVETIQPTTPVVYRPRDMAVSLGLSFTSILALFLW